MTPLPPEVYWKLRALQGDLHLERQRADAVIQAKTQAAQAILTAAGLDPSKNYILKDETCTVEDAP